MNRDVASRGVEQFEELQLGVFERRVRHVVNERDLDGRAVAGSDRAHAFFLRQAGWDSASIHYDWHVLPLKRMKGDNRESMRQTVPQLRPSLWGRRRSQRESQWSLVSCA